MKRSSTLLASLAFIILSGACSAAPQPPAAAAIDASAIHTTVAKTLFAAAALTPMAAPSPPVQAQPTGSIPTPTPEITPTSSPTPVPAVITVPTMENVPMLAGYTTAGARKLEQPVAVVREGIMLAVEQVAVYADSIELVYTLRDIPHESLFDPMTTEESNTCGGPESYPNLILPGGEIIYAENYMLDGKAYDTITGPFARVYSIHIYRAAVPANVGEMTLYLDCIALARLDSAPRYWRVPFRIAP